MEVHFSPDVETRLQQVAVANGKDAEQLVKHTVLRLIQAESTIRPPAPELPVWDLGAVGSLHRRDLYDDAH